MKEHDAQKRFTNPNDSSLINCVNCKSKPEAKIDVTMKSGEHQRINLALLVLVMPNGQRNAIQASGKMALRPISISTLVLEW